MKKETKEILRNYWFAYRHANGLKRTKHLRLRYKNGWFWIGGFESYWDMNYRKNDIINMTNNLNTRPHKD